ncbi:delta-60 repeat domain-containing protein [Nocardiopsis mwathae]|nr:delta-60 repeat domain-containing protein [Nocardiopsis mwathae]
MLTAALSTLTLLASALTAGPADAAPAATPHTRVVGERPVSWTPHVLDGSVKTIAQVGDVVVVGGDFTRVTDPRRQRTHTRENIFAFDYGTGRIRPDFAPRVKGTVRSLAAGPGDTVYVGGSFTGIDGDGRRGVARLSVFTGRPVDGFSASLGNGSVYRLASYDDELYIGGTFHSVNGVSRAALALLDAYTGEVDTGFDMRLSNSRRGSLRVQELALSPGGTRLVVGGTFTRVLGQRRYQVAMVDTGVEPARLSRWSTEAYSAPCDYNRIHTYIRQIDFAPDGSYFVIVTAGGPYLKPGLCKTAARWETGDIPNARYTWVNHTGGDSLYSVAATGPAVYVGGHQRWMDNPRGHLNAGPGAVHREGVAALDPRTGASLPWNPGRQRGHGAEALTATPTGLFIGSDTERLAGYKRDRIGMFPLR